MRRKDREITDMRRMYEIMDSCVCCRLGLYDDGEIYIVPLNFGYAQVNDATVLYFHGAKEGRKIDLIRKARSVGFEMDAECKLIEGRTACAYSAEFQSIIGSGEVSFIDDQAEKEAALQAIMFHNTKKKDWTFTASAIDSVCVFQVVVRQISCKCHDS